jgi:hypothetical protein
MTRAKYKEGITMNRNRRHCMAIAFLLFLVCAIQAGAQTMQYSIHGPLDRLKKLDALGTVREARITAARGEYEGVQIVIRAAAQ